MSSVPFLGFNKLHLFAIVSGFNVETVEYKNISFTVWDVGGQDKVCGIINKLSKFYMV